MSNKGPSSKKILLKEGYKLITDDIEITNVLSKHYVNYVRCLVEKSGCNVQVFDINDEKDPLDNIVTRFQLHLSIIEIKEKVSNKSLILFYLQLKKFYWK